MTDKQKIKYIVIIFVFAASTTSAQQDSLANRSIDRLAKIFHHPSQNKEFSNFSLPLINDSIIELQKYKGNVIVLNFWFIGCPPCMGEIGDLNKVYNTYKDTSVKIISLANNSKEQLIQFINGKNSKPIESIQYPIVPNASTVIKQYQVTGYPTTMLIDKTGMIRLVISGASLSSLQKYAAFYSEKDLSKDWKQVLKDNKNTKQDDMNKILTELINDLLKE